MSNKINGRTPEEIKKGLECCSDGFTCPKNCPYGSVCGGARMQLNADALDYIQQLERERDAAAADMTELMQLAQFCRHCKHLTTDGECTFDFAANKGQPWCWQWRGVQEEV